MSGTREMINPCLRLSRFVVQRTGVTFEKAAACS